MSGIYRTEAGARAVAAAYDAALAGWPVPQTSIEVDTRQGRTSIVACGPEDGPPLVLLHGAASNALMWMGEVGRLARTHRVLAVDLVGEPGRSAPTRPPWTGPAWVLWLDEVLEALGVGTLRLAAVSQGGYVALRFATARPERVARLALLAPAGVVTDRPSFLLRALPLLLLGRRGARRLNRLVAGPAELGPEAEAFMELVLTHLRPRTDASPLLDDEALRRLTMPVLLLAGEADVIRDGRAIAARLERLVPRLETHLLPEAGHVLLGTAERLATFFEGA